MLKIVLLMENLKILSILDYIINITNCNSTPQYIHGMIIFYDDRTGGSAGDLVNQNMLTIKNNKIKMDNSKYVITGINKSTVNNINITFKDNTLLSSKLKLYNEECTKCENIKITE